MSEAYFSEGSEPMVALERMIDKAGIRNVVYALAHIASEKADHLATNWQDETAAQKWRSLSLQFDRVAHTIRVPGA